jgi:hypothetical protein
MTLADNMPSQMKKYSSISNVVAALFLHPPTNSISSTSCTVLMSYWAQQAPYIFTFIQWQQSRPSLNGPAVKIAIKTETCNPLCAWCTFNVHLCRLVTNFLLSCTLSASFYKDLPIWIRKIGLLTKWKWFKKRPWLKAFLWSVWRNSRMSRSDLSYTYPDSKQDFQA